MSAVLAAAPAIPLNSTSGRYVAAAYIVVVLVILIYVSIMAVRAQRLERELAELRRDLEAARATTEHDDPVLEREQVAGRLTRSPAVASPDGERGPA